MAELDLAIRGGTVLTAETTARLDLGIAEGRIVALAPELSENAAETIDARGLHVFPGVVDAHVHFNEPGRADWEGLETGSRAFAAGGGTTFFDMPLNSHPPVLDAASFDAKLAAAQANSITDFALWGGLVPGNLDKLPEMHERGAVGFKAFMCASGIDDFPRVDDRSLRAGMKRAAQLGSIVAVHAENESLTRALAQERTATGRTTARDYLDSRPVAAEVDAIRRALNLAGETGCALHVVHVSCGEGVALIAEAREQGVDVSCETCPHYLTLNEEDVLRLGAPAKCAPPLRSPGTQEDLWRHLHAGEVATVGSDHSPSPPALKGGEDFFKLWGGIAGVQHTLPLLLSEGHARRGLPLPAIARLIAFNPARRFGLAPRKGGIQPGADADLALVNLSAEEEIRREDLLDRHRLSPYVGRKVRGAVLRTLVRGQTVFAQRKIVSKPLGCLVKPARPGQVCSPAFRRPLDQRAGQSRDNQRT
jgi:allantoinase